MNSLTTGIIIKNPEALNLNNIINSEDFDFEYARKKVMELVKIDGEHFIWQRINKDGTVGVITIKGRHFYPNMLLAQCELKKFLPKGTRSKKICDKEHCISPECCVVLNNENANYKLAKIRLEKNSIQCGKCRLYLKALDVDGYGISSFKGVYITAHRLAMILHLNSEIQDNLKVRHKCRNRNCISIECLELGTSFDNNQDMIRDGTALIGEKNPSATITNEIAKKIFESKDLKTANERSILFNVPIHIINNIDNGKSWNKITGLPKKKNKNKNIEIEVDEKMFRSICENKRKYIEEKSNKFIDDFGEHWISTLQETKSGYCRCTFMGHTVMMHKVSWIVFNEQLIPDNLQVLHSCKFKNCINPKHLSLGTPTKNNNDDKKRDGTLPQGSKRYNSRITEDIALEIYKSKGIGTQNERAEKFNVSRNIINNIDNGKSWNYLFENLSTEDIETKIVNLTNSSKTNIT